MLDQILLTLNKNPMKTEIKEELKEELTHQNVPKAVNYLINEIAEMRVLLEHIESQLGLGVDKHRPIGIDDACRNRLLENIFFQQFCQ
jgi:hypothetical protein